MEWSPANSQDSALYWISLAKWLPTGVTVSSPSVTVDPIVGDVTPLVVMGSAIIDSGERELWVNPGVKLLDPGPRIQVKLAGGTPGMTYTTRVGWSDSRGQTLKRAVTLFVEA